MKRTRILILIAAFLGATGFAVLTTYGLVVHDAHWLEEVIGGYVWDAHFKLNVNTHSKSSLPTHHVRYVFASRREEADLISRYNCEAEYPFKSVEDFDGTRFIVYAPCSGRSWFGVDYGYVEPYRFLVLRVDHGNAMQLKTFAEIPTGRGLRSMTIEIP